MWSTFGVPPPPRTMVFVQKRNDNDNEKFGVDEDNNNDGCKPIRKLDAYYNGTTRMKA